MKIYGMKIDKQVLGVGWGRGSVVQHVKYVKSLDNEHGCQGASLLNIKGEHSNFKFCRFV